MLKIYHKNTGKIVKVYKKQKMQEFACNLANGLL